MARKKDDKTGQPDCVYIIPPRRELATALHKIAQTNKMVPCPGLRVRTNGGFTTVNPILYPVAAGPSLEVLLYLVILDKKGGSP